MTGSAPGVFREDFSENPAQDRTPEVETPSGSSAKRPGRVEDDWDEPEPPEDGGASDLEGLQGAWLSVSGRRPAELLIAGRHFTMRFQDGAIYMGAFDLEPAARPKTMDMRIDEGPPRHLGKTALCIYELASGALRWCAAEPGKGERLGAFPPEDDPHYLALWFRREQPT
jgi:uncharacterized protein (TIGR03067 family)